MKNIIFRYIELINYLFGLKHICLLFVSSLDKKFKTSNVDNFLNKLTNNFCLFVTLTYIEPSNNRYKFL